MIRYILKRLLLLIPVIIVVSFIVFMLMELTPGDITDFFVTDEMTAQELQELREYFNLHRSVFYRYGRYMLNLAQGDLGVSDFTRISVWYLFSSRLPNTLILSFSALAIGMVIAIPMGIIAARRAGKLMDNVTTGFALVGMSMPVFWIGILLLVWFSANLGWFPAGNFDGWRSIILPALCSSLTLIASATRQTRSSMLEVLKADYLRTARAKGVPEEVVVRRHALGNAWIPIITALGTSLGMQLAGSVVVESVFTWPGIGRLAAEAVSARDVTTTTGVIVMTTVLYVLVFLVVDVIYAFVDPRIKAQYVTGKRKKKASAQLPKLNTEPAVGGLAASAQTSETAKAAPQPAAQAAPQTAAPQAVAASAESASSVPPVPLKSFATRDLSINEKSQSVSDSGKSVSEQYKKKSQLREILHHMSRNKGALTGMIILGSLILIFLGSLFITWEQVTQGLSPLREFRLQPPSWQHPFGTDGNARDVFLRVIYGSRYSLSIGFGAAGLAAVIGVTLGAFAGFYGKLFDELIMRFSDILASIPGILLGMVIISVLGQNLPNLIVAVGVAAIPIYIRITRAAVLTVRNNEYIEAAKSIGLSNFRIIFTQVLPNSLAPLIVAASVNLGMNIIVAASLSFLGFGIPVPAPEWGAMISVNRDFAHVAQYLMTFPGLFIMFTVLSFNLIGDGLRDALDPKLKKR
ncbi:MAG: ABC transporter permease subunit [Oscillospiraceae bacterium]|nr:ABC transporter permease subunit [Oscillospiraceae bacterium]